MEHLLESKCQHLNKAQNIQRRKEQSVRSVWTGDFHVHPQMVLLLNRDFGYFPYDYIGNLTADFEAAFRMILDEFSDSFHRNHSLYAEYVQRARNRESGSYGEVDRGNVVQREDLSDDDIRRICEIYWIDYICLPFDVPAQCNITDLFVKHYGDDVTYRDCYFV